MTNHVVDNSIKNLGKAVLWQYDRAVRLLAIMKHIQVLYHCAIEQFWDYWTNKVLAMDTIGSFGCSLWGIFLGVPRPTVIDDDGTERLIVTSVYRRVLKGAFYFMKASCNFKDILGYLEIVFGISGNDNLSKWNVTVSEYGWTTNIDELNDLYEVGRAYSKDEVIWYHTDTDEVGNNYKFTRDVTEEENTSWAAISGAVEKTNEATTGNASSDTMLLKLYDPEGICRKIGGSPKGSLSISLLYEFGNTTITAKAVRMRKCGITLTDNGDMTMTYGKSAYYDEMHRDQKKLFEQRIEEYCPYPLGIGSGEPVEEWVLGFGAWSAADEYGTYVIGWAYSAGKKIVGRLSYEENDRVWLVEKTFLGSQKLTIDELYEKGYISPFSDEVEDIGQDNEKYKDKIGYSKGDIFGYVDKKGHGFNYVCLDDISPTENLSFDTIKDKVQKTKEGDPFADTFSMETDSWRVPNGAESTMLYFLAFFPSSVWGGEHIAWIMPSSLGNGVIHMIGDILAIIDGVLPEKWYYLLPGSEGMTYSGNGNYKYLTYVQYSSFSDLWNKFYGYIDENAIVSKIYDYTQIKAFMPKYIYPEGSVVKIGDVNYIVCRSLKERMYDFEIPKYNAGWNSVFGGDFNNYKFSSMSEYMEIAKIAPKTSFISDSTQKRIGQIK